MCEKRGQVNGFGDIHINLALRNRLTPPGERIPVMVLGLADETTDPMTFRDDIWAHKLLYSVYSGRDFGVPGESFVRRPYELSALKSFEVAVHNKVAIWHGGFCGITSRLDSVVEWLKENDDCVLIPSPWLTGQI